MCSAELAGRAGGAAKEVETKHNTRLAVSATPTRTRITVWRMLPLTSFIRTEQIVGENGTREQVRKKLWCLPERTGGMNQFYVCNAVYVEILRPPAADSG